MEGEIQSSVSLFLLLFLLCFLWHRLVLSLSLFSSARKCVRYHIISCGQDQSPEEDSDRFWSFSTDFLCLGIEEACATHFDPLTDETIMTKVKKEGEYTWFRGSSLVFYSNSEGVSSSPLFSGLDGGPSLGFPAAITSSIFRIIVAASPADFKACSLTARGS